MTRYADDAEEIRRKLEDQIESLLDRLYPGWVKRGPKGYLTPKSLKQLGSFQVNLTGAHRGQWYRFSQEVGGGTVELISYAHTGGTKAYDIAFREARRFLGMDERAPADGGAAAARRDAEKRDAEDRRQRAEAAESEARSRRAATASDIWAECRPIAGTLAEKYLVDRGIPVPPDGWPDVVGFHRRLEWRTGEAGPRQWFPCLVGRVDGVDGEVIAIWRVFLDPDGHGKAKVDNPKLGLGPAKGGAVRLGGVAAKVGVAEGIETAFGAWWLCGRRFPVWAALSTSGMAGLEIPLAVNRIVIFPDGDKPLTRDRETREFIPADGGAGIRAARALHGRAAAAGIPSVIEAEPPIGVDYLDLWNKAAAMEMQ